MDHFFISDFHPGRYYRLCSWALTWPAPSQSRRHQSNLSRVPESKSRPEQLSGPFMFSGFSQPLYSQANIGHLFADASYRLGDLDLGIRSGVLA